MSISSEIQALNTSRQNIAAAIAQKGGTVSENDGFSQFATAITNLPSGGDDSTLIDLIEGDITTLNIPNGTTGIRPRCFNSCSKLTSVTIPNTVTSIGTYAFNGCSKLTSVTIPNTVTSIGDSTFRDCTSLTSITIPNGVTAIGPYAFNNCTSLTSITIPSSVTTIGGSTFQNCTGLTSLVVNATTPPTLGTNAFNNTNNCPIYVPFDSIDTYKAASGWSTYASRIQGLAMKFTPSGGGAVIVAGNNDGYISRSEVPSDILNGTGALEICDGMYATQNVNSTGTFNQCTGITSVTLPDSLAEIQDHSFRQCTNLASVTFGNSLNFIGVSGFMHTAVTSIELTISLESIGNYAFEDCTELETVTIGNSGDSGIQSIGDEAFAINTSGLTGSLTTVTIWASTPPTLGNGVFMNQNSLAHIYVPVGSLDAYKAASGWSDYASIIEAIPSTMLDGNGTYSLGYDPDYEAVINYEGICTCSGKDYSGSGFVAYDSSGQEITSGLNPTFTMTGAPTGWSASDLQTLESWLMNGITWDYGQLDCNQTDDETGECVDFNYGWLLNIEPGNAPSFEDASLYSLIGTNWGIDMTVTIDGTSITKHIGLQLSSGSQDDWYSGCEECGGGDEPEPEPDPEEPEEPEE